MKFDYESLSSEPLFYMLMHSGAFVTVLGGIFFIVGLLFGYATWGRYKRQTRELRAEAAAMKEEIAGLKRKVGDHSVKPGPSVSLATETIHMPSKEGTAAAAAIPAVTAETITTRDIRMPAASAPAAPASGPQPKAVANVIKPKAAESPAPAQEVAVQTTAKPAEPPASEPSTSVTTIVSAGPLPPPARHVSPLSSIIAPAQAPVKPEKEAVNSEKPASAGLVPTDTIPTLTEISVPPLPAVEVQAVEDPRLGLVYKTRPEKVDDLTALKGIAEVLESRLHEIGIYTYAQIASWNEENIKEFSSRLAFKDRIQRERWVEQAKDLVSKTAVPSA